MAHRKTFTAGKDESLEWDAFERKLSNHLNDDQDPVGEIRVTKTFDFVSQVPIIATLNGNILMLIELWISFTILIHSWIKEDLKTETTAVVNDKKVILYCN